MPACPESFLLLPVINALLLVKNVIKPVGWAISHQKIQTMNQFVILSFEVDPLNWPSFIEIGEIACSTPAWCTLLLIKHIFLSHRRTAPELKAAILK